MAKLPRGLWFVLTLWLVLSRPSAASRVESPHSSQWWGTEAFSGIQDSAKKLRQAGDYAGLEKLYLQAIQKARQARIADAETSYRTALANTYVFLYRYPEALNAYRSARELAESRGDWEAAGAIAPGLSSLYFLLGDRDSARQAAEAGFDASHRLTKRPYYESQLALQLARLHPDEAQMRAAALAAVEASWNAEEWKPALEAEAWDLLGEERLRGRDLAGAEAAFSEGHRLRALHVKHDLRLSYWRLASLRLAQNRLDEAERFNAQAQNTSSGAATQLSSGTLLHQRGIIRASQGRVEESLTDLQAATEGAERWRTIVPAAQASLVAADTELDSTVFRDFVENGARTSLNSGDAAWSRRAFAAVERNRAQSLRDTRGLAEVWREKLPARYWAALSELRRTESQTMESSQAAEVSKKLHLELTEMEASAGLGYSLNSLESVSTQDSLNHFQQSLRDSELFLSFYTGAGESYLWAATRNSLHVYKLPSADRIKKDADRFQSAIVGRETKTAESGAALFHELFGGLTQTERSKTAWVLSLDGPLFGLPFAALREDGQYLVERHTLQVTPGAAFLGERASSPRSAGFVGVGDPIYNWADERLRPAEWSLRTASYELPGQLNRLVASGEEVRRSARFSKAATVLTGDQASRQTFVDTLRAAHPSTIHLATHVVAEGREKAFLALSVGKGGSPELIGTSDIAMLHVPDALVVMTGCSSGAGEARAGAGLLGLTRAWLVAGARGVVAAGWPVEDTNGGLLDVFYREVSSVSTSEALRRGQVEMIHSGTWQADPSYWAAFQLTGGVR